MRFVQLITLFIGLICFTSEVQAQSTFKNTFSTSGGFRHAALTADDGFVACAAGSTDVIIKIDQDGQIVWSTTLNTEFQHLPSKIVATGENDDVFIMGMVVIDGTGSIMLTKLDRDGNLIKSKQFFHSATNFAWDMIADGRGGIMIVGGGCNGSNFVIRSDNDLNIEWQKGYGILATATATAITLLDNGNFVVGGYAYDGTDSRPYCIYTINPQGDLLWSKVITGFGETRVIRILELENGDLAVLSVSKPLPLPTADDIILMRLSNEAALIWSRRLSTGGWEGFEDMVELADGSIMLVGNNSFGIGGDALIGNVTAEGELAYLLNIPGEANNNLTSENITTILPVCENKFAVFGYLDGMGMAFINDKGEGFCESELIPEDIFEFSLPQQEPTEDGLLENSLNFAVNDITVDANYDLLSQTIYCDYLDPEANECMTSSANDLYTSTNIELKPNPANHSIQIHTGSLIPDYTQILNSHGKFVMELTALDVPIDISCLSAGIYFVKCTYQNQIITQRFIKI